MTILKRSSREGSMMLLQAKGKWSNVALACLKTDLGLVKIELKDQFQTSAYAMEPSGHICSLGSTA